MEDWLALFLIIWGVIGCFAASKLLNDNPYSQTYKQVVVVLICGPFVWFVVVCIICFIPFARLYEMLEDWLRED